MALVVASIASALITLAAIQQTPTGAVSAQTPEALSAELVAYADAMLAAEKVQLSAEDRSALHGRIRWAVNPASPDRRVALRSEVEKAVRKIVAATRNPDLATLAIQTNALRDDSIFSPDGAVTRRSDGRLKVQCFSATTFEQLRVHASKVVAAEPNSSRLNIALTALLASADERRSRKPPSGSTCVDRERVDALKKELDVLLSQPVPNEARPSDDSVVPAGSRSLSAVSRQPSATTAAPGVRMAPKGIVSAILALCPYPFCD